MSPDDCPHRDLVAHANWWACAQCGLPIERHESIEGYLAAMRQRLATRRPLRSRSGVQDGEEVAAGG